MDWKSAKQSTTAMYSTEAEYIVTAKASMKAVWMRKFINRLGGFMTSNKRPMKMLCDNEPTIAIIDDPKILKGARKYHYIREELSCVHDMFHVSNLKKCLAEPDVQVPLDEIEIDENMHFVEEPTEIIQRDVKKLKRRRIPLVKVRWNSRQGAEYTWERGDQFRKKYPHLFTEPVPSSSAAT
nr:putative reverse transcriptase domain-containing protein [Tanacetum cinerariifolium]